MKLASYLRLLVLFLDKLQVTFILQGVADSFFSKNEKEKFDSAPNHQHKELFFRFWTRKEALLKATGEGLSGKPDTIDTSSGMQINMTMKRSPEKNKNDSCFFNLMDIDCFPDAVSALAVEGNIPKIRLFFWNDRKNINEWY